MSLTYGPQAATRADANRATMRTAAVNADPGASLADRQAAAEAEMAALESYWHTHGTPAYAGRSTRESPARGAAEHGDYEAGQ